MTYQKGHYCNNGCVYFTIDYVTRFDNHGSEWDDKVLFCCRDCDENHKNCRELPKVKTNCSDYSKSATKAKVVE